MPLTLATSQDEPQAPVHMLTEVQREAVLALLFGVEFTRVQGRFVAGDGTEIGASTALALMKREMILLRCRRERIESRDRHRPLYRYTIALTQRGQWYARTVLRLRQQLSGNILAMSEAAE